MQLFSVPVITTLLISCSGLPVLAAEARDAESYFNTNAGSSVDMPFYGFFTALNLYQFDVFKNSSAPDTSRYMDRL